MNSIQPPTPLSIALGRAMHELQKLQYQKPDKETEQLLDSLATYQQKLVMGSRELPTTKEQVRQAA